MERKAKTPKLIHIYSTITNLIEKEERCIEFVRGSEQEVRDVLEQRTQEELTTELSVSIYDTARNDTAKKRREEIVSSYFEINLSVFIQSADFFGPHFSEDISFC